MKKQQFGGKWTIEKLSILSDYLNFYVDALKNQPFKLLYIDAFAGSGHITTTDGEKQIEGSARLALKSKLPFDEYIFIEKNIKYASELRKIVDNEFPELANKVKIQTGDCNEKLTIISETVDWRKTRAILFFDPYATAVKYDTLQSIASTKAMDVWYLFPIMAARRLMPNDVTVYDSYASWKKKLNELFGSDDWYEQFYKESKQFSMFGNDIGMDRIADVETLKSYILERLGKVFPNVASNPRMLYNTNNQLLFMFCFAVSNPDVKAYGLALKVANHILNKDWSDQVGE